jgi:drug/metabolite transporter (DMT)-like permease
MAGPSAQAGVVRKDHLDGVAIALLLACSLFWGFQQVLVKATIVELAPAFQAAVRFAGSTLCLWLWCRWRGIPLFERDGSLRDGLVAGALFAAEFALLFCAMSYTSASRVTVFAYTAPFWVAALVPLFVRSERLGTTQWIGLLLAFVAVLVALSDGLGQGAPAGLWWGDLLAVCGGAAWGLTTVVIRARGLTRLSPEKLLFYQVAVSSLLLPVLSWLLGERWTWPWTPFAAASIIVQAVIGAFASYLVWMWLLGRYPATRISVFAFFTPVFALIIGPLWLGERVGPNLLLSVALVAAGIVLVNRKQVPPVVPPTGGLTS